MSKSSGAPRPTTGANPEYTAAMQEIRRSNATTPVPSGTRYKRRPKHAKDKNSDY